MRADWIRWEPRARCPYCKAQMIFSESEPDEEQGRYAHRACQSAALYARVRALRRENEIAGDPSRRGAQHRPSIDINRKSRIS